MATKIRLSRGGSKKRPFYRIVAADARAPRDGDFIEKLGTYNPALPKDSAERFKYDAERVKYWLGTGAQPTDAIARFLRKDGVLTTAPSYTAKPNSGKLKPRAQARKDAEIAAQAKLAEEAAAAKAAAEAAAAAPAVEEVAAEEPAAEAPAAE
jgi:small subunit ribosomal protein S16